MVLSGRASVIARRTLTGDPGARFELMMAKASRKEDRERFMVKRPQVGSPLLDKGEMRKRLPWRNRELVMEIRRGLTTRTGGAPDTKILGGQVWRWHFSGFSAAEKPAARLRSMGHGCRGTLDRARKKDRAAPSRRRGLRRPLGPRPAPFPH